MFAERNRYINRISKQKATQEGGFLVSRSISAQGKRRGSISRNYYFTREPTVGVPETLRPVIEPEIAPLELPS